MQNYAIVDIETTGSYYASHSITEIAIILHDGKKVIDSFQSLVNPESPISPYVSRLTGITNEMVSSAPPISKVMREAALFVGQLPLVAHNASFDCRFWQAELEALSVGSANPFACTLLLARRIYPQSPNHQLLTLAQYLALPTAGRAHRAMADVEVTTRLWSRLCVDTARTYNLEGVRHELLMRVQRTPRDQIRKLLAGHVSAGRSVLHTGPPIPASVLAPVSVPVRVAEVPRPVPVTPPIEGRMGQTAHGAPGVRAAHPPVHRPHAGAIRTPSSPPSSSQSQAKPHGFWSRIFASLR